MNGEAKPTPCPGCGATMQPQRLARRTYGEESIDACLTCQAFWFDAFESAQLAPGATLALFDVVRKAAAPARPLPARLPCPRCTEPLELTHDLQRTTRFLYYRCAAGHGRFTPFLQFLRENDGMLDLHRRGVATTATAATSAGAAVDLVALGLAAAAALMGR